jgi:membrane protease YdiL (CAAX protease family)
MNRVGLAWIGVIILQYIIAFAVYLSFAAATGKGINFYSLLPSDMLRTLKEAQTVLSGTPFPYTLTLFLSTLIADIVPFAVCSKKVGIISTDEIFSKPKTSASEVAIFGVVSFGASIACSIVVQIIVSILKLVNIKTVSPEISIPWDNVPAAIIMIITVVLIGPFAEEYLCRGVILNVFKRFGSVFAVVGSSLIWALLHGNIVQGIPVFVMGIFFGILALKAKSILPTFIIHAINNLFAVFQLAAKNISGNAAASIISLLAIASFVIMAFAVAIVFFCTYRKKFIIESTSADTYGFKTFFTSPSIIVGIVICLALTLRTFSIG